MNNCDLPPQILYTNHRNAFVWNSNVRFVTNSVCFTKKAFVFSCSMNYLYFAQEIDADFTGSLWWTVANLQQQQHTGTQHTHTPATHVPHAPHTHTLTSIRS